MGTPNRFAIREVALATFYSLKTGDAIVQLDSLKSSGIENTASTVYAMGGRGNPKLVGFSSDREARFTLEDALFDVKAIAMMTGNSIIEDTKDIYKREILVVESDKVTLSDVPVGESVISLFKLQEDGSHGEELFEGVDLLDPDTDFIVNGSDIEFETGELDDGASVVVYYQYASKPTSKTITVSSDKFAGTYKLVLDCLVRDAFTKEDYEAQIVVHNAKLEDEWSMNFAPDGDPATFTMNLEALKPVHTKDLYTMTIYED